MSSPKRPKLATATGPEPASDNASRLNGYITAIVRAYRVLDSRYSASPTNALTRQELFVVDRLGSVGPTIMSELASYLDVAVNTVTTVIDALERKELVRRVRADDNRRKVWVKLTPRGRDVHTAYLAEQHRMVKFFLSALNPDEQQIHLVLMNKIGLAAEALVAEKTAL